MSIDLYVRGFIPPTEKFQEMKKIYDLCEKMDIEPPEEVLAFFNFDAPENEGVVVEIKNAISILQDEWGYSVDITKLPKDVTIIKFTADS
jgi:hypothetical protein